MLDEIVLEVEGDRYLGHVWADPAVPALGGHSVLRWRFSKHGHFVAEFPALPTDTHDVVRTRLVGALHRTQSRDELRWRRT